MRKLLLMITVGILLAKAQPIQTDSENAEPYLIDGIHLNVATPCENTELYLHDFTPPEE